MVRGTSNGTQLMTPYVATNAGYISRVVLQNVGARRRYLQRRLPGGNRQHRQPPGPNVSTIPANGQLVVLDVSDVCTPSGNTRFAAVFTINAPSASIQGR